MMTRFDHRRADDRFHTRIDWLDSRHSFSFGPHYDPSDTGHGLLLVNNDDRVAPGAGFPPHAHRDAEIVTWVLSGALEHADTMGNRGIIGPGQAQRMSAGTGVRHAEMNPSDTEPVHFVQMWVLPDRRGYEPSYEQLDISDRLATGALVAVASGAGHEGAVHLNQADAVLWAARMPPSSTIEVPGGPHVHIFVPVGSGTLEGVGALGTGDAVRATASGPLGFVSADAGAEVLIWVTD